MKHHRIKGDKKTRGLAALALTFIAVAVFSGCGGRVEGETAVSEAPVKPTATIAVTASAVSAPLATPTPTPKPVPTPTLTPTLEPTPTLTPTPTPVPTATPTPPPPTPTPAQFRPVDPPELVDLPGAAGGAPIFQVSRLSIKGRVLSLAGTVTDRPDLAAEKWTVQVWQSRYEVEPSGNCTTEKPVAFIMPPSGSGNAFVPAATPYQWTYCIQGQGYSRETNVPWLRATSWKLAEHDRRYIFEPRVWDFSMAADLQDARVRALEYASPAGWTILVWAGDILVAREWVRF